MLHLSNDQNGVNGAVNDAYAKCHSQIVKLKSYIQQKRSDRNHNDPEILKTISNAASSSPYASKPIPNLRCTAKIQRHYGKVYALCWFPDSSKLVTAAQDGKMLVSEVARNLLLFSIQLNSAWIMTCAVSTSGKYIASAGLNNTVSVFDVSDISQSNFVANETHKKVEIMEHEGYISGTQFIDDNRIISVSGDLTARIFDLHKQKCLKVFNYPSDIECVSINPQKSVFLSGCIDSCIYLDDYRTKSSSQHVGKYIGHQTDINGVKWFPDHMSFVSGSDDSTARLWDMRSYEQMNVYQDNNIFAAVTSVDVSHSGYYIFVGYDEDPFCVAWNTLTADREQTLQHDTRVSCLQMSPNGLALATGSWDRKIRIWSTASRNSIFDNMSTCEMCMCYCTICALWCMHCSRCKCCN